MSIPSEQIRIHVKKFEAVITDMAWGIAEEIFEAQRRSLISGLTNVAAKASKSPKSLVKTSHPPKVIRAVRLLDSKTGTWDRGGGPYKVLGPGKKPETFDLEHRFSGKKINATLKTLAFRWKHTP